MNGPVHEAGAIVLSDESVSFRVWAPHAQKVSLVLGRDEPREIVLEAELDGYFSTITREARPGDRYGFRLNNAPEVLPDPRSRFQPEGVHGLSEVVHFQHLRDSQWSGRELEELVIYELHVGTFTAVGTFRAAIDRLDELVELGITAIELMPLAQCPGRWNWGYDGVFLFAVSRLYGRPEDCRALIDAAHERGLAVIVDVVYNHLGPEGNYLRFFGPYFTDRYQTPWGPAMNYDGPESVGARAFVAENAIFWLREYGADGLRLDATRTIYDGSERHILLEIGERSHALGEAEGRRIHVFAENNIHAARITRALQEGGFGLDAQWCDDLGHALTATLDRPQILGSRPYMGFRDLAIALRQGFSFQATEAGEYSVVENAAPADRSRLVVFLQNHDIVGNHPLGKRLTALVSEVAHRAAVPLVLLYPAIPLLFMGEESGSEEPFWFFADFSDEHLCRAVEVGRIEDFPHHDWTGSISPLSQKAFLESKLPASEIASPMQFWYRRLLEIRRGWQEEGILSDARLHIETDEASATVLFRYTEEGGNDGFVLVRLAKEDSAEADPEVRITGQPKLLARSSRDQVSAATKRSPVKLRPGEALVGRGRIGFRT